MPLGSSWAAEEGRKIERVDEIADEGRQAVGA